MTAGVARIAIAFAVYTLALLGAAFGIAYAVFEWQDEGPGLDTSAIERRLDELEERVGTEPTQAELDSERCAAALAAAGNLESTGDSVGDDIRQAEIREAINRYCK